MLLVATAIPVVQSLGGPAILLLKLIELLRLGIHAQIFLHLLVCTKTQKPAKRIGLTASQITAHMIMLGIAKPPPVNAMIHHKALPIPGLSLLDLLKPVLKI